MANIYTVTLTSGDDQAWLGRDGQAHASPTPDPEQATFATAEEAAAAPIPDGWTAQVVRPRY